MATTTYLALPSKDPSVLSGSTSGNYTVALGKSLDFSGRPYEVFLLEAALPFTWHNVTPDNDTLVLSSSVTAPFRVQLPPSHYNSIPDLLKGLNAAFKSKDVAFAAVPQNLQVDITLPTGFYLEGPLLGLLGWPKNAKIGGGTTRSPKIADVTGGLASLYVYLSIVGNSAQGSFSVPLLKEVPVGNARFGDIIQYRQKLPVETHMLNTPILRSIEVNIKDRFNNTVDFNNTPVSLTIGIRPV
jgi:hypothetical protein